jgi:WD40 repeat protein
MVLFVLFAGSVGLVILRWEPWVVENVRSLTNEKHDYLLPPDLKYMKLNLDKKIVLTATKQALGNISRGQWCDYAEGKVILIVYEHGLARLWDWETGRELCTLNVRVARMGSFSPDGRRVLVHDSDGMQHVCDTSNGQTLCSQQFRSEMRRGQFSADGRFFVAASDNLIYFWNIDKNEIFNSVDTVDRVQILGFSPDGKTVLADDLKSMGLWYCDSGKLCKRFPNRWSAKTALFSPDGNYIAISNFFSDYRTILISTESEKEGAHLKDHAFCFFPDGKHIITDGDEALRIWECDSGRLCGTVPGRYTDLWFSSDGKSFYGRRQGMELATCVQRFSDHRFGHLARPEVWLAIIFGSLWIWRASVWWRERRAA